jgi:hypothetical protein
MHISGIAASDTKFDNRNISRDIKVIIKQNPSPWKMGWRIAISHILADPGSDMAVIYISDMTGLAASDI